MPDVRTALLGADVRLTVRFGVLSVVVLVVAAAAAVASTGVLGLLAVAVVVPGVLAVVHAFRNRGLVLSWALTGLAGGSFGFVLLATAHLNPPPTAAQIVRAMAWYGGWYAAVGGTAFHAVGVAAAWSYGRVRGD